MLWILIILVTGMDRPATATQEFNTLPACALAAQAVNARARSMGASVSANSFCVAKGVVK